MIFGPSDFTFQVSLDKDNNSVVQFKSKANLLKDSDEYDDALIDLSDFLYDEELYETEDFIYESDLSVEETVNKLKELGFTQ